MADHPDSFDETFRLSSVGDDGDASSSSSSLSQSLPPRRSKTHSRADTMVESAVKALALGPAEPQPQTAVGMRRPRRPATQKREDDNELREESQKLMQSYMEERERHAHRRKGRRDGRNTKRSQTLEESLDSLRNFAKTSKSRSLNDIYLKGLVSSVGHNQADSPADGVHYVNRFDVDSPDGAAGAAAGGGVGGGGGAGGTRGLTSSGAGGGGGGGPPYLGPGFQRRAVVEDELGKARAVASNAFVMPMEPRGTKLTINILSTWGDPHYVGLMGVEIYDGSGHLVEVRRMWEVVQSVAGRAGRREREEETCGKWGRGGGACVCMYVCACLSVCLCVYLHARSVVALLLHWHDNDVAIDLPRALGCRVDPPRGGVLWCAVPCNQSINKTVHQPREAAVGRPRGHQRAGRVQQRPAHGECV
jgi:hypothetical protein